MCKVSVIIPAYNVELYIEQCIRSILAQVYSDIEVIVVDDGSTDDTSRILDELSMIDNRITVIHKQNSGVSAARNTGLKKATGEYIIFVDGDDYLSEDAVSYMIGITESTKSPFCISKNCYTKKNEKQVQTEIISSVTSSEGIALLLSPEIIVGCWNKIYRKSFLDENGIRFSESLFYGEGLSFITECAQKAETIGIGNRKVYYYRRNNELSATTVFNIEKIYNGEKSIDLIENRIFDDENIVKSMLLLHRCMFYAGAIVRMKTYHVSKIYLSEYKKWLSYIRKHYFTILFDSKISIYRKGLILGCCISPNFMALLDRIRRSRNINNSI